MPLTEVPTCDTSKAEQSSVQLLLAPVCVWKSGTGRMGLLSAASLTPSLGLLEPQNRNGAQSLFLE